jgi:hypothetical protein
MAAASETARIVQRASRLVRGAEPLFVSVSVPARPGSLSTGTLSSRVVVIRLLLLSF